MTAIFSTAYLAPVEYYATLLTYRKIQVEQYDSYQKQTYRNRCVILGANGPLSLTIPIVKQSGLKALVKDVKIDYATPWQKNHWRSIISSYNSSPFFEFYKTELVPFYENKWKFLIDYNTELHHLISLWLDVDVEIERTDAFQVHFEGDDLRAAISPKKHKAVEVDAKFVPFNYTQTYFEKFDFIPNLSIIDLLFNTGPESELILQRSIVS